MYKLTIYDENDKNVSVVLPYIPKEGETINFEEDAPILEGYYQVLHVYHYFDKNNEFSSTELRVISTS